jgi:MoaA/NifB/PqqE/SkfB family radical SAM enzyme
MSPFKSHKLLGHLPILNKYVNKESFSPILVEIDLTNLCASACPWCAGYLDRKWSSATLFASGESPIERLSSSISGVMRLLEELHSINVKAVTWTGGGDPTQHKALAQIIEYAAYLGFKQALITHGVIDVSHVIHHLEWVRFSVDGATEKGYGKQHGKPEHFKRVINNIAISTQRKADDGLGVTVGVGFLTHKDSWDEIVPFACMWKDIPVDYIQYRPLHDTHGQHWNSDTPDVIGLIQTAAMYDSRVTWSEAKYQDIARGASGKTKMCHGIYFESAISADGKVYTCCHHKGNENFAIGDLYNESFDTIWKRHQKTTFVVDEACPAFCRHLGTNELIENEILIKRQHPEFI